jgi:hypothetical protein
MTVKNNNVIPFNKNRKKGAADPVDVAKERLYGKPAKSNAATALIDLNERREEKLASEKRAVTRTVLSQFLGVFLVLPNKGLQPVSLHDVSEAGLSFDLPTEVGSYEISETVTMRIYLSHDTYFSFHAKIANKRSSSSQGVARHGAVFRKDDESFKTLFYFTKFLENVGLVARRDTGDRLLGRID